jgi:hypothetical protein
MMSIEVEVNLRIPTLTIRSPHEPDRRIDNSVVRFTKLIQVPSIAKPGAPLQLSVSSGQTLDCTVTRADWHEQSERFVVSCTYAKKSISPDLYNALVNDEDWKTKMLV